MAVDSPSAAYLEMASRWKQMRDCVAGSQVVKAAGTTYLPALAGHQPSNRSDEYWAYNSRALYYAATARTIDGLGGMIFRRPPVVRLPPAAATLMRDVDMLGRRLEDFCDEVTREDLTTGRAGVLVEHTRPVSSDSSSGGLAAAVERRPYLVKYEAEKILDTVYETRGGARQLVRVRLLEELDPPSGEEFETEAVEIIRVLELVGGVYRQRVFVLTDVRDPKAERPTKEFREDPAKAIEPTLSDGSTIDFIPFWVGDRIEPPPLLDLSDVNLAHYRTDADYRNGLHMAGVPTPYCTGMAKPQPPDDEVHVGTAQFLWFSAPEAKVGFLTYGADGMAALRQALNDLESMMAFLGARMLQPDRPGVEAAETARIHRMGEISILARRSNILSNHLTEAVRFMLQWADIPTTDEHMVRLNDDFLPAQAPANLLTEMVKAWQAGGISHDSLWRFMQEGELVDPRRTIEEEQAIIGQEAPEPEPEDELALEAQALGVEQQRVALEQQRDGEPAPPARQRAAA